MTLHLCMIEGIYVITIAGYLPDGNKNDISKCDLSFTIIFSS